MYFFQISDIFEKWKNIHNPFKNVSVSWKNTNKINNLIELKKKSISKVFVEARLNIAQSYAYTYPVENIFLLGWQRP